MVYSLVTTRTDLAAAGQLALDTALATWRRRIDDLEARVAALEAGR